MATDPEKYATPSTHSLDESNGQPPAYLGNQHDGVREVEAPEGIDERKLLMKIDLRVLPVLCILYLLAFIDRVNISNAAIYGLKTDLGLTGTQYNTVLTIFFVPYILFEIPSNMFLKKLRPHVWLSGCMFFFGLVITMQGLTQNYSGILATRFFLGLFEAGMFPGCFYLIAMWYKRSEGQKRYSFFFSSTSLAGAFGGLLASAIGKMDGMQGYKGWRWIFILEGILTCIVSAICYFIITDFPEDAKFLTPEERAFVKARLAADVGDSGHDTPLTFREALRILKDFKIVLSGIMYLGLVVPAYGYAYFAPSIIQTFHYSQVQTQLHSVPPWAASFALSMIVAFASDYFRHRFLFTLLPMSIAITGFGLLVSGQYSNHVNYAALFFAAMGCYAAMPVIVCWSAMNVGGHNRRAVASAWQVGFGNIGGIIATYSFLSKDAPKYKPGYSICLAFICLSAASCALYAFLVSRENRKRDQMGSVRAEGETEGKGDLDPGYRYLL